jgi:coatomer protein complex subunit epsilon
VRAHEAAQSAHESLLEVLRSWLADETLRSDAGFRLVAAHVLYELGDLSGALATIQADDGLEARALSAQIYLRIARLDLAVRALKGMQDVDDDDTITQMTTVAVLLRQGAPENLSEALESLQDIVSKFGNTVNVLNTMAVCHIRSRAYVDAFNCLKLARQLALKQGLKVAAETLVNTIVCLQLLGKPPSIVQRITDELRTAHPGHSFIAAQAEAVDKFNQCAANYLADR